MLLPRGGGGTLGISGWGGAAGTLFPLWGGAPPPPPGALAGYKKSRPVPRSASSNNTNK